ncbi:MAG: glycosyltransferase family 39 protein [Candidatus Saccharibacteria bacterium]
MNKLLKKLKSLKSSSAINKTDLLIIGLGLFVFVSIALLTITKSSIWFDEAYGAYMIKFNFLDIVRYTANDIHPPFFYWLLKLWSMCFGNSEFALRSMSVFFGGVSIVFGYLLSNRLFNKNVARVSLIFMVLSPMFIRYSQEARMYTLMTAIALIATYILTFAINTKKKLLWVVYGILVGLGMLTHYFMAVIWVAHWLWRADIFRRQFSGLKFFKKFFSSDWIISHVIAVIVFLPWVYYFLRQILSVQVGGFWIQPITPSTVVNFFTNSIYYQDVSNTTGWLSLIFMVLLIGMILLAIRVNRQLNSFDKQSYRLILSITFVPIVLIFLASLPPLRSAFVDRYLIPSTVGLSIFIGATLVFGLKGLKTRWQILAVALFAGLMMIGISNVWVVGNFNKNMGQSNIARQVIELIKANSEEGQPIVVESPFSLFEFAFYESDNRPVFFIEEDKYKKMGSLDMLKYNDDHKIKDEPEFSRSNPVVWYVAYQGANDLIPPISNCSVSKRLFMNDPITNKTAYQIIECLTGAH